MMKKLLCILWVVVWAFSASAEVRVWTGEDGKRFEGEFVRELLGRIQIRDTKETLHLIPLEKMTKTDRTYVQSNIVPEMEITVRQSTTQKPRMEWTIGGDVTKLCTCEITLKKKSRMDSDTPLTAELYFFGDEVDGSNYVLVRYEKKKFVFPKGKNSVLKWVVKDIHLRKYDAKWTEKTRWRGVTYRGYMVTVIAPNGEVVASKTDLGNEKWLADGLEPALEKLRKLAYEGRGSPFSRHFNNQIQKTRVPRIEWYQRTKFF